MEISCVEAPAQMTSHIGLDFFVLQPIRHICLPD